MVSITAREFYAYLYLRKNGTPYYAGKGQGNRAHESYPGHRPPKDRSRILIFPRSSEAEAFETEKELIRNWGRKDLGTGCLYNRTDGGEGPSGCKRPLDLVLALGRALTGRKYSAQHRARISKSLSGNQRRKGTKHSQETLQKMSDASKGHKRLLGHKQSEEHRRKISEAAKRQWAEGRGRKWSS